MQNFNEAITRLKNYNLNDCDFFKISKGWNKIFKKRKYITEKGIANFLLPKNNIVHGIGVTNNNQKKEEEKFNTLLEITKRQIPNLERELKNICCEEIFGEIPFNLPNNVKLTRSNLLNFGTYHELKELVFPMIQKKEIKILEIGSGYGELARQVLKYSGYNRICYDFIDLPNNLFFCELYLGAVFGLQSLDRSKFLVNPGSRSNKNKISLNFYDPSETAKLAEKYDLIINTYSFQEMTVSSLNAYVNLIEEKLSQNGLFFSINSPQKWDVKSYSDYNFQKFFSISSYMHRAIPPSGHKATVAIVNLFRKRKKTDKPINELTLKRINMIGLLQNKGFSNLLINHSIDGKLSITDPDSSVCKILDEIIYSAEKNLKWGKQTPLAEVLHCCIASKKISKDVIYSFLKKYKTSNLSDLSIVLLNELSLHKSLKEASTQIYKNYNFKKDNFYMKVRRKIKMFFIRFI